MKNGKILYLTSMLLFINFLSMLYAIPTMATNSKVKAQNDTKKIVEVCFVIDTTGSMGNLIRGAKQKIWQIATKIAQRQDTPTIRFSLIGYRDRNDKYVTKLINLSEDLDEVHAQLMQFQAAGGGDFAESVNQALHEAVNKVAWSSHKQNSKIIFLVGDAPPHMKYKQDIDYTVSCQQAHKKGIIINSIQCGNNSLTKQAWQHIAKLGGGSYLTIAQSGGVKVIKAPQDEAIAKLTLSLNATVIPYGNQKQQLQAKWKVNYVNKQLEADTTLNASRAEHIASYKKGTAKIFLGNNDLVTEWGDKKISISNLNRKFLPSNLKKLSDVKLITKIEQTIAQRQDLQKKLNILLKERATYIAQEKKKDTAKSSPNSFDIAVEKLLKLQIK